MEGVFVRKLVKKDIFEKGGQLWTKKIYTVTGRSGFKVLLDDDSLNDPRQLKLTKMEPTGNVSQRIDELREITKDKRVKEKLKAEDIVAENIRPKRDRKVVDAGFNIR